MQVLQADQPLVVAVSRPPAVHSAMPSSVTSVDPAAAAAAAQLLVRAPQPLPGHVMSAPATGHVMTAPPGHVMTAGGSGVATHASQPALSVDTATPTVLPLGVVVTRHLSPDVAKNILQQSAGLNQSHPSGLGLEP